MAALAMVLASPAVAQQSDSTDERHEVLAVTIGYAIANLPAKLRDGPLVLDTLRTAPDGGDAAAILDSLRRTLPVRAGNVEDHCVRIEDLRRTERSMGLAQWAVRGASVVIAAHIVEWSPESGSAVVRVPAWFGRGIHTGGAETLRVEKGPSGWEVTDRLTLSTGSCSTPPARRRGWH